MAIIMKKWILGTKKGSKKIESYETIEEAQIHSDGGWEVVPAYNLEAARTKYREVMKQLYEKSGR